MENDVPLQPNNIIDFNSQNCNIIKSKLAAFIKNKTNILMMLILITKLFVFFLFYSLYQNKLIVICDSVIIIITIIGFGLMIYNKAWSLWIHWVIYIGHYIIIIIIQFSIIRSSNEIDMMHKDIFENFIFLNVYIQNSFFFIGDIHYNLGKIRFRIHLSMWILLTISILFVINFSFKFLCETITFSYCFIFALFGFYGRLNALGDINICNRNWNSNEVHFGKMRNKSEKRLSCDSKEILHSGYDSVSSFYGSCIVNEQLMIKHQNAYFLEHMKDICVKKAIPYLITNNNNNKTIKITNTLYGASSSKLISMTNSNNSPLNKSNNSIGLFLNGENIILRDENEECNLAKVNLKDVFYFKFVYLMKSSTLQYKSNTQFKDKFIELGKFKYISLSKEKRHYEVYCRAIGVNNNNINENHNHSNANMIMHSNQNDNELLYELAFYELTDNLKKNKMKIEKKYKTLLLRKINHEFKVPIVLIQNMINEINEASTSVLVKSISKTIKYVTETILLLVSDLTEYIHLNTMKVEDKEMKSASGFVEIYSLYQDIQNICFVYTKVFNKNVSIEFEISDLLKTGKIMINENKVKQILSILITNAIKNSTQIIISFNLNEKPEQERKTLLKCLTSSIKSIENSQFNILPVNQYNLSPKAKRLQNGPEYEIVISIEDNGPGIDNKILNTINSTFNRSNRNNDGVSGQLLPMMTFNSYKNQKGLGTGLVIGMKLCKDLNITLNCQIIGSESQVQGTKFILSINSDITFEDLNNESCIYEFHTESSNLSVLSESVRTNEVFIENFNYGNYNKTLNPTSIPTPTLLNKSKSKSKSPVASRKSRTCLFYKSRYGYNLGELTSIAPIKVINFTINAVINHPKGYHKIISHKYADIPLFNDSDVEYSFENDKLINYNRKYKRKIGLTPTTKDKYNNKTCSIKAFQNHHYNSKEKIEKKSSFNSTNIIKLKGFKNQSRARSGSSQGISLFNQEAKMLRNIKQVKDIELDYNSSNCSIIENKSAIVIVDDIDSNKKAIYSLVNKQLIKKGKGNLYEFKLLSDGIELINIFYEYQSNDKTIKLIICDESMNYLNGSDAFGIINKISITKGTKAIPFILCSAFSDNGFKEQMVSIGIKNLYEKPLQSSNIERIIQEFEL